MHWGSPVTLTIALIAVAGMLIRPWRSSEWMWALGGAAAEIAVGAVSLSGAWNAVAGGLNVYGFLAGILVLAEVARSQGVFEWLAGYAEAAANRSRAHLLLLLYGVGVAVTATLSNDTAIIVLTPAALALGRRIGGSPLPYLFACAFVANAASFLLPTGNPANLLLYGHDVPALLPWLRTYGMAAVATIVLTYIGLVWSFRADLRPATTEQREARPRSTPASRLAFFVLIASAVVLVFASTVGWALGPTALVCAAGAVAIVLRVDRTVAGYVLRETSWSVVPLVAGLLVVVAALEGAGITQLSRAALDSVSTLSPWLGRELAGFSTTTFVVAANNLPVAAFAQRALAATPTHSLLHAVVVGIDLGPNLSLSGSLATVLWLVVLRREGIVVTPWQFLFRGAPILLPTMFVALLLAP
jgi:arsenical pump membrane protein